jgi:hypothetical protein
MIQVQKSWDEALERVLKILHEQYDNELVNVWDVNPTTRIDAQGVYLPPVGHWYRQAAPSNTQMLKPQHHVAGFVGPAAPSRYSDIKSIIGSGYAGEALLPFALSIYFTDAPQGEVADPQQPGEQLGAEAILLKRALRYMGALTGVLTRYGCQNAAVADVTPLSDFALGGEIDSMEQGTGRTLRGVVVAELLIQQEVLFPPHTPLPTI